MMEEDDPLVSCPFDSGHQILRSRMPYHISRCSKNDPRKHLFANKRRCDFDASHFVDKKDYPKHLEECPAARKVLDCQTLDKEDKTESSILPVNPNANSEDGGWGKGEWGDEAKFPSYNPQEAIQNRPIIQTEIGLSRAQRRIRRNQERRRINELSQNGTGSTSRE